VTFGYQYEGPPTCVHGGVIAEMFDELLGSANVITDQGGMTGTLTVRYRKPTPLLAELDLVARMTRTEGRKIFAWGGMYHRGVLTAEAEGIFIRMQPSRMLEVITQNAREAGVSVVDPAFAQLIADSAAT
jgi:acyl-coenzyme A thioesterase PaaI-like protein